MGQIDIGRTIDRLRIARGMEKKELAEKSGIDAGNLNRIISGKQRATLERLEQMAEALGLRVSEVLRLAETGQVEDQRKTAMIRMIEQLETDQMDRLFRRWPDGDGKPKYLPIRGSARKISGK